MPSKKSVKRTSRKTKKSVWQSMPYPLILFLLLCAGTYLVAATLRSYAADIHVTAKVSAPYVTSPAVIDSPVEGQHFSSIPLTVSGTCPANAAYVEIFVNGIMKGTAICDGSANFSLAADLYPGADSLTAHVFNMTDDEGPVSSALTVYYDAPQPPAPKPSASEPVSKPSTSAQARPPQLYTEFVYKGYYAGDQIRWPLRVTGGQNPYELSIDWGDGTITNQPQASAGDLYIDHIYSRPGTSKGSFTIKVTAKDDAGSAAHLQFFVIVVDKQGVVTNGSIFSKPPPSLNSRKWLWIAWPAYSIVLVMTLSFWLGERQELLLLKKKGRLKRP